jgi:multisite-specific tRNA:(cytosine-C5)-methyltransferase
MIPPLLLDVEPHHFVSWRGEARWSDHEADNATFSVPGYVCRSWFQGGSFAVSVRGDVPLTHLVTSQTAQIMEALNPHTAPTTGLLIANDADAKRCHMLVHQTGRMPSIGLGVTCNDAGA